MPPVGLRDMTEKFSPKLKGEAAEQVERIQDLEREVRDYPSWGVVLPEPEKPTWRKPEVEIAAMSERVYYSAAEDESVHMAAWLERSHSGNVTLYTQQYDKSTEPTEAESATYVPAGEPKERVYWDGKYVTFEDFSPDTVGNEIFLTEPDAYESMLTDVKETLDLIQQARYNRRLGQNAVEGQAIYLPAPVSAS